MEGDKEISEMTEKMKAMTESLNEKMFQNPIKDVQREMLKDVLELKQIMLKNITAISKEDLNQKQIVSTCNSEEFNTVKTALDHKIYQVERLKEAFNEYEQKKETEVNELRTQNEKLKYRINILVKELDEKENKTIK